MVKLLFLRRFLIFVPKKCAFRMTVLDGFIL